MRAPLLLLAAASPLRCGPPPRDQRAIPTGRYAYDATVVLPGARDSARFAGHLVVERATPDSLGGRTEVAGLAPAWREARFEVVGYRLVLPLASDTSAALVHSIRRDGDRVRCRVSASTPGAFVDGRCTLRQVAP